MKTRLFLALVLCCAVVVGVIACEDLGTTPSTTTAGTATTAGPGTTAAPETTTTVSPETSTTAAPTTTTTTAPATTTTKAPVTTTTKKPPAITTTTKGPAAQEKLLKGTWTWDVDKDVDGAGADDDLHYEIVDELVHYLVPRNGATLARLPGKPFAAVTLSDVMAAAYSSDGLATEGVDDPNVLMPGDVIALVTNNGMYVKMQVVGFEAQDVEGMVIQRYNMRLRYVAYPL